MRHAIVLLSGGMDSGMMFRLALAQNRVVWPLMFDYGQRHIRELEYAEQQVHYWARIYKGQVPNYIRFKIDLTQIGQSSLTEDIDVPKGDTRFFDQVKQKGRPATYVPARNTILLSIALGYAEALSLMREPISEIWHGANKLDSDGYPDCRTGYFNQLEQTFNLATKMTADERKPITIKTPLIQMDKVAILKEGNHLGVPWRMTWSCYNGREKACGVCPSCVLRLRAFEAVGASDPLPYESTATLR